MIKKLSVHGQETLLTLANVIEEHGGVVIAISPSLWVDGHTLWYRVVADAQSRILDQIARLGMLAQ